MDATVAVAITSAISTVTLAALGIVGTVINAKLNRAERDRNDATKSTDLQLKEIHTLTNSNWSQTKEQLAAANNKISSLQDMISELRNPTAGGKPPSALPAGPLVQISPVPVADATVAAASKQTAEATTRLADVAEAAAKKET